MAESRETDLVTVAAIRKGKDKPQQYLLNERQRIFCARRQAAAKDDSARLLTEALESARRSRSRSTPSGRSSSGSARRRQRELEAFAKTHIPLAKAETDTHRPDRRREDRPDPVQHRRRLSQVALLPPLHADHPELREGKGDLRLLRAALVPPARAVRGHALHSVPVRSDGCYARAHQMRRIITTRYRYCCEKVFSFAPYKRR